MPTAAVLPSFIDDSTDALHMGHCANAGNIMKTITITRSTSHNFVLIKMCSKIKPNSIPIEHDHFKSNRR